jgi:hypothetical protein
MYVVSQNKLTITNNFFRAHCSVGYCKVEKKRTHDKEIKREKKIERERKREKERDRES